MNALERLEQEYEDVNRALEAAAAPYRQRLAELKAQMDVLRIAALQERMGEPVLSAGQPIRITRDFIASWKRNYANTADVDCPYNAETTIVEILPKGSVVVKLVSYGVTSRPYGMVQAMRQAWLEQEAARVRLEFGEEGDE